jgi:hypothetical protein
VLVLVNNGGDRSGSSSSGIVKIGRQQNKVAHELEDCIVLLFLLFRPVLYLRQFFISYCKCR